MRFLAVLSLLVLSAFGQDWQGIFEESGAPAMVVVVVRGSTVRVEGFGESARGSGKKPGPESLLRIGSLSKLMAGELLSGLVLEGKLELEDSLSKFASRQAARAEDITLLQLATHTSGLPRNGAGADRWQWLSSLPVLKHDASKALYSNVAFDFLADALAKAAGKPYAEILQERLTMPLGMKDTTARPSAAQCQRLLGGTELDPTTPCNDMTSTAGSGGMYSTGADMARWMQHLLQVDAQSVVSQTVYVQRKELTNVEGLDHAGEASGLGLGWVYLAAQNKRPELLQKTGGGGGFMSYIAISPARKMGVFVAMTRVDLDASKRLAASVNHAMELLSSSRR